MRAAGIVELKMVCRPFARRLPDPGRVIECILRVILDMFPWKRSSNRSVSAQEPEFDHLTGKTFHV